MSRIPKDKDGNVIIPPPIKPLPEVRIINGQPVAMIMQTRSYELITPMFGGGAQPALADADMVVRPSGIR
ncbi:MAG: type III-B CRISPR module RAMP protein Cmr1, partial [Bacillota bacterium]